MRLVCSFPVLRLVCAVAILASPAAGETTIGLWFDEQGTTIERAQAASETGTAWILARLEDEPAALGIVGAEFRLDGFPGDWFGTPVANPASNFVLGSPIVEGTHIAFETCQGAAPSSSPVLLFTLNYFATSVVDRHVLGIVGHTSPSNPEFACPLVVVCDPPSYTRVCVTGGRAAFNYPGFVAVESSTWSVVKSLYE